MIPLLQRYGAKPGNSHTHSSVIDVDDWSAGRSHALQILFQTVRVLYYTQSSKRTDHNIPSTDRVLSSWRKGKSLSWKLTVDTVLLYSSSLVVIVIFTNLGHRNFPYVHASLPSLFSLVR